MKLTPLDIRHQEFRRAMRGYSEEQVDVFLDEVADEFERLFQDNIELRERILLLDERVAGCEDLKETLNNTLVSAQQLADTTRANARIEADTMRANARMEADTVRANAHNEGELVVRDAEIKARGVVSEAYSEKQRVQQSLIQLRQMEEDFRLKFRSLLEAHINLLGEDEASEEARRFRDLVTAVEQESAPSLLELVPSLPEDVAASPAAEESSILSTETAPAPETVGAADQEAVVAVNAEADVEVEVEAELSDDIDPRGYVTEPPDAEFFPPEVVPHKPVDHSFTAATSGEQAAGDEALEDEALGDEGAGDERAGDEAARDEDRGSTVRRFLFGKRDKPDSGELSERTDRDFEW